MAALQRSLKGGGSLGGGGGGSGTASGTGAGTVAAAEPEARVGVTAAAAADGTTALAEGTEESAQSPVAPPSDSGSLSPSSAQQEGTPATRSGSLAEKLFAQINEHFDY
jgi:hypothetical protein